MTPSDMQCPNGASTSSPGLSAFADYPRYEGGTHQQPHRGCGLTLRSGKHSIQLRTLFLTITLFLAANVSTFAQSTGDTTKPQAPAQQKQPAPAPSDDTTKTAPPPETPLQAEGRKVFDRITLERDFKEALTGATLQGIWQVTTEGGLKGNAPLSEPKSESYDIISAAKMTDDRWVIMARIRFGEKDVTLPVPLRVVWAEDTAVITLDDLSLPMLGTYSARVMIHHGFYSGVWYCNPKNYGGVLTGRIVKKTADAAPSDTAPAPDPEKPRTPDK